MDDEIIEGLIHHIFNGDDYLPRFYIDICSECSSVYCDGGGLYDLICFKCEKCGNIDNHMEDKMICGVCLYP